eukprot:Protomagalhaensia_wolfi_Nauph_80__6253@NODE_950_length_1857_cov_22_175468_g717_i0_p1_GENE_NODE_950_length_1857_cov_22_175468_g717_i0NODE_950_length_1857_cov_22_175468_g717_i0_p1_ORF_typecomplete_len440_score46_40Ras/PF00071_22/1_1e59Roc/PF08477_13/1_8e27Arf/PF00025_21/1_2e18FeoB_N/PF02421_18/4_6e08Gtr1_RagA/PF04670_12/6_7e08GTP_EFTU/PF00009_27/1_7e05ATP_bind_1/PF03029_17/0_00012SRPRB/PF09439_10/0_00038RsgA_GTPase/PF03193_16/80RsgA_GTPase/PF03193_16/0_083MMR_HSR1/PF01926_23/0_15MMR_HSR1/PF01926_2
MGYKNMKAKGRDVDAVLKLLLLGDGAVGKSSLLLRYCENKFDHKHIITIGVDFKSKLIQLGDETVRLQIWDTAGQERFRNITPVYFRSAMGVVLVFDVTSVKSFENVSYWLESLSKHASHEMSKVIVGNKVDLADRQVSRRRGEALAAKHGLHYLETSALMNSGVAEVFESLALQIRQKQIADKPGFAPDKSRFRLEAASELSDGFAPKSRPTCCGIALGGKGSSSRVDAKTVILEGPRSGSPRSESGGTRSPKPLKVRSLSKIKKNPIFVTAASQSTESMSPQERSDTQRPSREHLRSHPEHTPMSRNHGMRVIPEHSTPSGSGGGGEGSSHIKDHRFSPRQHHMRGSRCIESPAAKATLFSSSDGKPIQKHEKQEDVTNPATPTVIAGTATTGTTTPQPRKTRRVIRVSDGDVLRCPSVISEAHDYGRRIQRSRIDT